MELNVEESDCPDSHVTCTKGMWSQEMDLISRVWFLLEAAVPGIRSLTGKNILYKANELL